MSSCSSSKCIIFNLCFNSIIFILFSVLHQIVHFNYLHYRFQHVDLRFEYHFYPYSLKSSTHKCCIFHNQHSQIVCIHLQARCTGSYHIWHLRGVSFHPLLLQNCCCEKNLFCTFNCKMYSYRFTFMDIYYYPFQHYFNKFVILIMKY